MPENLWRHLMEHDALGYATLAWGLIRSLGEYAMATAGSPDVLLVQELTKRLLTVSVQFSEERLGDVQASRVKEVLVTAPLWCAALIAATGVRSGEGDAIQALARRIDYEGRAEEQWNAITRAPFVPSSGGLPRWGTRRRERPNARGTALDPCSPATSLPLSPKTATMTPQNQTLSP